MYPTTSNRYDCACANWLVRLVAINKNALRLTAFVWDYKPQTVMFQCHHFYFLRVITTRRQCIANLDCIVYCCSPKWQISSHFFRWVIEHPQPCFFVCSDPLGGMLLFWVEIFVASLLFLGPSSFVLLISFVCLCFSSVLFYWLFLNFGELFFSYFARISFGLLGMAYFKHLFWPFRSLPFSWRFHLRQKIKLNSCDERFCHGRTMCYGAVIFARLVEFNFEFAPAHFSSAVVMVC